MTREEYIKKWGNEPPPKTGAPQEQYDDWSTLNAQAREYIKQPQAEHEGPTASEMALRQDIWGRISGGSGVTPDFNMWRMLSESLGFSPQQIRQFAMKNLGGLFEKPDFGKEYGLKGAELERQWASKASARGLLDSSGSQAALGGGLADLMMGRAQMEENARMNRLGLGTSLIGNFTGMAQQQGFNKANWLNAQYLQDIGLRTEALQYLRDERGARNQNEQFNTSVLAGLGGYQAYTGADFAGSILSAAAQIYGMTQGVPPTGGMTGGGGGDPLRVGAQNQSNQGVLPSDWWERSGWGGGG